MSTIKCRRKPSNFQFRETMFQLVGHVWKGLRRFPKSSIDIQNELRRLIDTAEDYLVVASNIQTGNILELQNKKLNFEKALGTLDAFDVKMSRFIDHYGHGKNEDGKVILSEYSIKHMAELVDDEVKLIKGCLKKCDELIKQLEERI